MVEGVVLPAAQPALSPEQQASAFEAWSVNHQATPPLSDYAVLMDYLNRKTRTIH